MTAVEDLVLAELQAARHAERERNGWRPGLGARPFVPAVGCSLLDLRPGQLADLITYVDAGYLTIVATDPFPREPKAAA